MATIHRCQANELMVSYLTTPKSGESSRQEKIMKWKLPNEVGFYVVCLRIEQ